MGDLPLPVYNHEDIVKENPPKLEKPNQQPAPPDNPDVYHVKDEKTGLTYYPDKDPKHNKKKVPTPLIIDMRSPYRQGLKTRLQKFCEDNDNNMSKATIQFLAEGLLNRGY